MVTDQIIEQEELVKADKWFQQSYGDRPKSHDEIQLLILYKLHQLEEKLKVVEHQTKTHWAN